MNENLNAGASPGAQDRALRIYGARGRIALLVPSTNTVAEIEFWQMAPPGVTVHTSRMSFLPLRDSAPLKSMEAQAPRVLEEAVSAQPDIIAYGCTASSAKPDPDAYREKLEATAGVATVTAAGALLAALGALDATEVILVTPYPAAVNAHECEFFAQNGVTVLADESVIVDEAQQQMRHMSRVPPRTLIERTVALAGKHRAQAIVLSCCDLPTLEAIPAIEAATGIPVISSTQALFWHAMRTAALNDSIAGHGQLLSEH
ncbi:MAG: maleate cis-trans isomerase [Gammaproteobacteria bacterium]|jgi:maleate cis-trans isomerase